MRRHHRLFIPLAIGAAAFGLGACDAKILHDDKGKTVQPSGKGDSRSFNATGFDAILLKGPDSVVVRKGASFSVVATGPADVLDKLRIRVDGTRLIVDRERSMGWTDGEGGATVTVTMPRLIAADLAGSGSLTADDASGPRVELAVAGSGDLKVKQVSAKDLELAVAGSGDLVVEGGSADTGEYDVAGSGDIDAAVSTQTLDASIAGSGDIRGVATQSADVSVVGSGDVTVTGGAKCTTSKMGSGDVTCG